MLFFPASSHIIHGELNAWHVDNTGGLWTRHFVERGPAPGGWRRIPFGQDTNVWWPWDVFNPDDGPRPLRVGDYVVMKGALWQDIGHYPSTQDMLNDPWFRGPTRGHTGWTEIHPVDWIVRLDEPKMPSRKTVTCPCALVNENERGSIDVWIDPPSGPASRRYTVGKIRELIDGRCTDMSTVSNYSAVNKSTHVEVNGALAGAADRQGRFKATYIVTWHETDIGGVAWLDDDVPAGATMAGDGEGWTWATTNPSPFKGSRAHQSASAIGVHQHFFYGATQVLAVNANDTLFAHVFLDPSDIPYEIMLQWNDGTWEHRAYWGTNLIDWGADGTVSRRYIGPIQIVGEWIRLEVPASLVGLEGRTVNGMAFTLFGGRATWDRAGKWSPPPPPPPEPRLTVRVEPYPVRLNQAQEITVHVHDANTKTAVPNAVVHIRNFGVIGPSQYPANAPFNITFQQERIFNPETKRWEEGEMPSGKVRASGYPETDVDFGF